MIALETAQCDANVNVCAAALEVVAASGSPDLIRELRSDSEPFPQPALPRLRGAGGAQPDRMRRAMLPLPKEEAPPLLTAHDFQRFADFFYQQHRHPVRANKRYFVDRRLQERIVNSGHRSFRRLFRRGPLGARRRRISGARQRDDGQRDLFLSRGSTSSIVSSIRCCRKS